MNTSQVKSSLFGHAYLLLTLAPLLWGANAVVGKLAANQLSAIELTFFRWFLAVVFIFFMTRKNIIQDWPVIKKYWRRLFFMGAFGFVGFNLSMYSALHYTTAINVAIAQAAIPMVIILLNRIFFAQAVFALQIVGVALAIFGVVVTVARGDVAGLLEGNLNRGDAMMIIAVACYALYSLSLRYKPEMNDFSFVFALAVASLIIMLPLMGWSISAHSLPQLSWSSIAIIVYIAVFPSFYAQLFYAKGIAKIGANRGGIFINLVPIFGAILAVLVLNEQFESYHMIGLSLVLSGIALAEWIVRKRDKLNT
ncbi:MAG: DMT family transporter [Oceanospirillaceae bacterium]